MNNQRTKTVVEGEALDPQRCHEQDWGGATPIIIRAYRHSGEDENTVHISSAIIGSAILEGSQLRDVPDLGEMTGSVFPVGIGRDDATTTQNTSIWAGCGRAA